jgi:hypothetical protein
MKTILEKVRELMDNSKHNEASELVRKHLDFSFDAEFLKNDYHFAGDESKRDIYKITLQRGQRKYSFEFGQSIVKSGFYAQYSRTKYNIPIEKLSLSDIELKRWVKYNLQYDFGNVKNDKIVRPIAPTLYDVLACLQKYDVGMFEDFCSEFGYDIDSSRAKKTYIAVVKEYNKMCSLFTDEELELLSEIILL